MKLSQLSPEAKQRLSKVLVFLLCLPGAIILAGGIGIALLLGGIVVGDRIPYIANFMMYSGRLPVEHSEFVSEFVMLLGSSSSDAGESGRAVKIRYRDGHVQHIQLAEDWGAISLLSVYQVERDVFWIIDCVIAEKIDTKTRQITSLRDGFHEQAHTHIGSFSDPNDKTRTIRVLASEPMPILKLIMSC